LVDGENGSPVVDRSVAAALAKALINSLYMPSWTKIRDPDMQASPLFMLQVHQRIVNDNREKPYKTPIDVHFTACSMSASSKIILGLLPPSSKETDFRFDFAEAS